MERIKEFVGDTRVRFIPHLRGEIGPSLVGQWLGRHASNAGDKSSIPAWGTEILRALQQGQMLILKNTRNLIHNRGEIK